MKTPLRSLFIGLLIINQYSIAQVNSGGGFHALQLCNDGTVKAWGRNANGQLGNGTYIDSPTPVQVYNLTNVVAVSSGGIHSLVLKADSTVWAWGMNTSGQLGNGNNNTSNFPVQVNNLTGVIAISAGAVHSMALKSDGTVWAWGSNGNGRLGDGTTTDRNYPIQVSGLSNITAIAGAGSHSLALRNDSTVWAWGHNNYGQLGNGNFTSSNLPVQSIGLSGITAIDGSNRYTSVAIKADSTVWSWGYNEYGQLGSGVFSTGSATPLMAIGLTDIIEIEAGQYHTIALKSDSTIWTWGRNDVGQLGHGTAADSSYPTQVANFSSVVHIAKGMLYDYTQVVKNDGTIWSWGSNFYGQFGNGSTGFTNTPTDATVLCSVTAYAENKEENEPVVFPNPCSGVFQISFSEDANKLSAIEVYNALGDVIYSVNNVNTIHRINIGEAGKGLYFIKIIQGAGTSFQKIIIE